MSISAPSRMKIDTIRVFAISKLGWIKKQQRKLRDQERETPREYLNRESHFVWGKRYLLEVVECDVAPSVDLKHRRMILNVRPGTTDMKKQAIVEGWYRDQIRAAVPPLIDKWGPLVGVNVDRFFVQRMRTKWGSCNAVSRSIRLNTDLAKKPSECIEYIVVHEIVHLLERRHNDRFKGYMDRFLPQWRVHRDELNRRPLAHEDWVY